MVGVSLCWEEMVQQQLKVGAVAPSLEQSALMAQLASRNSALVVDNEALLASRRVLVKGIFTPGH